MHFAYYQDTLLVQVTRSMQMDSKVKTMPHPEHDQP